MSSIIGAGNVMQHVKHIGCNEGETKRLLTKEGISEGKALDIMQVHFIGLTPRDRKFE